MTVNDAAHATVHSQTATRQTWLEAGPWLYLLLVVSVYMSGAALAARLAAWLGPMPVRGGLWTWAWSVDRAGPREALWLAGLTLAGAGVGTVLHGRTWPGVAGRAPWLLGIVAPATAALAGAVTMWYFRLDASLGDRINYLLMLRYQRWFIMSQPLSTAVLAAGHGLLTRAGWPTLPAAALVICLAGAVWIFVLLKLAAELRGWRGWLLVVCGLLTGGCAIFFGYIESTPIALASALVYFYLARQVLLRQAPLWPAALALGVTVAMHGQMLYLGPSFLILALAEWRSGRGRQLPLAVGLAVLPVAAVVGFALTHPALIEGKLYGDALGGGDGRIFVPLLRPGTYAEYYTLFSFNYFTELVNLILRVTPLLGALLVPAAWGAWQTRRQALTQWLLAVIGGALLLVLLWNPDLGMPHDWELFAPALMLITIACVCLWPADWRPRLGGAWLGAAGGFGVAALGLTLGYFAPVGSWEVWATPRVQPQHRSEARFGEHIDFLGHNGPEERYAAGETLTVQLLWRARAVLATDYTAGVYLVDTAGGSPRLIAQDDHRPEAPVPFPDPRYSSHWIVGEVVADEHTIVIPAETPPGEYEVWLALYDLQANTRLPVSSAAGQDVLPLLTVSVDG